MKFALILPEIILFSGALLILMFDVFLSKRFKEFFYFSHLASLMVCAGAVLFSIHNFITPEVAFNNMFSSTSFTAFAKIIMIALLIFVILISLNFVLSIKKFSAEFLALLMIATVGGMILLSANDFLVFYLGLELQALSLYLLAALKRDSKKSSESGVKYFVLGSVASGILLFGISMIYGFAGTTNFTALNDLYQGKFDTIPVNVMFGFVLVITAMFFKISAAPFHMWTPDVYEGAPTIVSCFFATVVKFSAVLVLMKLFLNVIIGWPGIEKIFTFAAILSLGIGSFGAIFQTNIKRLLAYSSISHVGFILLAISAFNRDGAAACTLYMIIYATISLGTFGFLNLLQSTKEIESDAEDEKIFAISSLSGLAKTNPAMAFALAVLMFSTAGIPPLAGFFSKFYVLVAIIERASFVVASIAVLFSVISAYYYLKVVKVMYFDEPKKDVMQVADIQNIKIVVLFFAIFNLVFLAFLQPIHGLLTNFLSFN